jgi:hypothetical protein
VGCTLGVSGGGTSGGYIGVSSRRFRIATSVVVFLIGVSPISVAQLIVGLLQIGRGISLSSGSVGLLDEGTGARHLFGRLWPLCGTASGHAAHEYGCRDES